MACLWRKQTLRGTGSSDEGGREFRDHTPKLQPAKLVACSPPTKETRDACLLGFIRVDTLYVDSVTAFSKESVISVISRSETREFPLLCHRRLRLPRIGNSLSS